MSNTKKEILTDLRSILKFHSSLGIDHYPQGEGTDSFLRIVPQLVGKVKVGVPQTVVPLSLVADQKKDPAPIKAPVKLSDIADEIATCHACELHKQRLYPVAGRGPDKIRLLIVGDWLSANEQGELSPDQLFGAAQDQMLSKMLMAIKLSATEVFVTNVIKCAVPANCQPQAVHVQSCSSFLRRQIVALLPEVILTMGMVAARAVLERSQPLSRLRGKFNDYQVGNNQSIPVISTYHPSYLLQNPEMKQATWTDLQLLAKKMGLL